MAREKKQRCEICNKISEELFAKNAFNGNRDDRFMCLKCYKKIHKEEFYDGTVEEILSNTERTKPEKEKGL